MAIQLQEFVRISFFYFIKNYDIDLAHREMTENSMDGIGSGSHSTGVSAIYAICRERITRHQLYDLEKAKLGGPGKEVVVDYTKLNMRDKKEQRSIEWLILGFMERESGTVSGRCRAYIVPNIKV